MISLKTNYARYGESLKPSSLRTNPLFMRWNLDSYWNLMFLGESAIDFDVYRLEFPGKTETGIYKGTLFDSIGKKPDKRVLIPVLDCLLDKPEVRFLDIPMKQTPESLFTAITGFFLSNEWRDQIVEIQRATGNQGFKLSVIGKFDQKLLDVSAQEQIRAIMAGEFNPLTGYKVFTDEDVMSCPEIALRLRNRQQPETPTA